VPAEAAAEVAALAVEGGVRGILNFAPVRLPAVPNVFIHQLDLATELMVISYYLSQE
jgi:redox-sensing transcriptional repressor